MGIRCYGWDAWNVWRGIAPGDRKNLKAHEREQTGAWADHPVFTASSYRQLAEYVAFLSVMNKRHQLAFRGQATDCEPFPALQRTQWTARPPGLGTWSMDIADNPVHHWSQLAAVSDSVANGLQDRLPRWRPFAERVTHPRLRVAAWAVVQHYELWPTPLIDVTTSLSVAASFALDTCRPKANDDGPDPSTTTSGFVHVYAVEPVVDDIMELRYTRGPATVRLSTVCPPDTLRPHLQQALLFGDPSFDDGDLVRHSCPLADRLVAKIEVVGGSGFWDFGTPHTHDSLFPEQDATPAWLGAARYRTIGSRVVFEP